LAYSNDTIVVCGQFNGELLYESCGNEMNITVRTGTSDGDNSLKGVAIYYESIYFEGDVFALLLDYFCFLVNF
jgi:hypothetical protein